MAQDEERIWASVTIVLGMGVFLVDILVDLLARRRHADPLLAVVRLAACVRSSTSPQIADAHTRTTREENLVPQEQDYDRGPSRSKVDLDQIKLYGIQIACARNSIVRVATRSWSCSSLSEACSCLG